MALFSFLVGFLHANRSSQKIGINTKVLSTYKKSSLSILYAPCMAFILLKALCARSLLYPFSMISYMISSVSSYLFLVFLLNSPVLANNLEILGTANVLKKPNSSERSISYGKQ